MQSRQFSEKRKGYDVQEIDEFIDEVMFSLSEYSSRLEAASARVVDLETKLAGLEQQASASEEVSAELARARQEVQEAQAEAARHAAEVAAASQSAAALSGQVEAARTQLEAARESHIRQQAQIVALQEEVAHLRGLLEQERSNPRPPEEVASAVEVLAAAQRTAEDLRREAQAEADNVREAADRERDDMLSGFLEEAAGIRSRIEHLGALEEEFRSRLSALLESARVSLLGEEIVSMPDDASDTSWIPQPRPSAAPEVTPIEVVESLPSVDDQAGLAEMFAADQPRSNQPSWGQSASSASESFSSDDSWSDAPAYTATATVEPEQGETDADSASVPAWGGNYVTPEVEDQPSSPADPYASDYDQPRAWGVSN